MVETKQRELYVETAKSVQLRPLIRKVALERPADALLLGGTDSAILAWARPLPAYTVVMAVAGQEGEDKRYSEQIARALKLKWEPITVSQETALDTLRLLIKINQSYDLGLLNDIAPFIAIDRAVKNGAGIIRSGQDPEMIFQGYEHLTVRSNVISEIDRLASGQYRLPLDSLEEYFRVKIDRPYLDPRILEFAKTLTRKDNVADNVADYGSVVQQQLNLPKRITKLTLRRTMVGILPFELAFRPMSDLEYGSGTYKLETKLEKLAGNKNLEEINQKGPPVFGNKAHYGMFILYSEAGLKPRRPNAHEYACKSCGGGVLRETTHCYTCGADPAMKPLGDWTVYR